jgi:hypothetical protein
MPKRSRKLALTISTILAWADAFHARTGRWPNRESSRIPSGQGLTWMAVHWLLQRGGQGLPGGLTLPRLLAEHRGVRNGLPPLTDKHILGWADAFHARTGRWPKRGCGRIPGQGLTWTAVDSLLRRGRRGLPGRSTLPRLLAQHRGVRNKARLPPLTDKEIMEWADAHHRHTGRWPTAASGAVAGTNGETSKVQGYCLTAGR